MKCVKCDTVLDDNNLRSWQEWSCGADERVPKCIPCLATDKVTVCHACKSVSKDADINVCSTCDKPFCENCNAEDGDNCVKCVDEDGNPKVKCDICGVIDYKNYAGGCEDRTCSKDLCFTHMVRIDDNHYCAEHAVEAAERVVAIIKGSPAVTPGNAHKTPVKEFVLWRLTSEDLAHVIARQPTEDECKEVKECFEDGGLDWEEDMRNAVQHCGLSGPDCVNCETPLEGFCNGDDLEDYKMRLNEDKDVLPQCNKCFKKHTAAVKEAKSAAEPSMEDLEAQVEAHLEAQAEIAMGK